MVKMNLAIDENVEGLVKVKKKIKVAISSLFSNDIYQGVRNCLAEKLYKYDAQLEGIILGYDRAKPGRLNHEATSEGFRTITTVKANFLLFQPIVGVELEGRVTAVHANSLACTVFDTFQATVCSSVQVQRQIGDPVRFIVTEIFYQGPMVCIAGRLSEEGAILSSSVALQSPLKENDSTEARSGKRKAAEEQKKNKKQKRGEEVEEEESSLQIPSDISRIPVPGSAQKKTKPTAVSSTGKTHETTNKTTAASKTQNATINATASKTVQQATSVAAASKTKGASAPKTKDKAGEELPEGWEKVKCISSKNEKNTWLVYRSKDGTKTFRSRAKMLAYVNGSAGIEQQQLQHNGTAEDHGEEVDAEEEEEECEVGDGASLAAVQQYVANRWHRAEDSSLLRQPALLLSDIRSELAALRAAAANTSQEMDTSQEEEEEVERARGGHEESILSPAVQQKLVEDMINKLSRKKKKKHRHNTSDLDATRG